MTALYAPLGKFRAVGVDTYDGTDWVSGDFDDKATALIAAEKEGGTMLKTHVYDDKGKNVGSFGTF